MRARTEPAKATAISEMADDIERIISLGERVIGVVGGTDALMRAGVDKVLAPAIKNNLERKLRELEAENGYMREVLLSLVDRDGPLQVERPTSPGRLSIAVDVRNREITIERAE